MEIDLELHPARAATFRSQVCVVGAGIAGLTLAQRLSAKGIVVALVEAGGHAITASARNALAQAQLSGTPHLGTTEGRFRVLGGSGAWWGGQLLPLPAGLCQDVLGPESSSDSRSLPDPPSLPGPNNAAALWSLDPAALAPYYREAERLLGVDSLPYAASEFLRRAHLPPSPVLEELTGGELEAQYSKWAPFSRRNLVATVGSALLGSGKTTVYLHAQVTELLLAPSRTHLAAVLVRSGAGGSFRFEAEHFVIAAGTVETTRLLLVSRSVAAEGVGNARNQVGRNFHDHLTLPVAQVAGPARVRLLQELGPWVLSGEAPAETSGRTSGGDSEGEVGSTLHSAKVAASPQLCRRLGLNAVLAHLTVEEPAGSGLAAVRELLHARQQGDLRSGLATHAAQLPRAAVEAIRLAWAAKANHRRFVSASAAVTLRLNAAQDTPSLSRITLSDRGADRDALGVPQVCVDWRVSGQELSTLRRFALHLEQRFAALGLDGFEWLPELFAPEAELPGLEDARHATGGACMGLDPSSSVVSPELRVHGVANLWIASAATLPTGSAQLPTLPLMALCLRLADRLAVALEA